MLSASRGIPFCLSPEHSSWLTSARTKPQLRPFVELAQRHSFDGVVNNAGVGKLQRLGEVDPAVVDQLMHFNLHSPINAVQAILPTLRQKGWGRIVNITSLVIVGMVNRTAYAASKAALGSFTRTWALEERVQPGRTAVTR
jgi:NAD(P)-dependent dehydrogenase (short-subunit alcohol dehydrogenase family)